MAAGRPGAGAGDRGGGEERVAAPSPAWVPCVSGRDGRDGEGETGGGDEGRGGRRGWTPAASRQDQSWFLSGRGGSSHGSRGRYRSIAGTGHSRPRRASPVPTRPLRRQRPAPSALRPARRPGDGAIGRRPISGGDGANLPGGLICASMSPSRRRLAPSGWPCVRDTPVAWGTRPLRVASSPCGPGARLVRTHKSCSVAASRLRVASRAAPARGHLFRKIPSFFFLSCPGVGRFYRDKHEPSNYTEASLAVGTPRLVPELAQPLPRQKHYR